MFEQEIWIDCLCSYCIFVNWTVRLFLFVSVPKVTFIINAVWTHSHQYLVWLYNVLHNSSTSYFLCFALPSCLFFFKNVDGVNSVVPLIVCGGKSTGGVFFFYDLKLERMNASLADLCKALNGKKCFVPHHAAANLTKCAMNSKLRNSILDNPLSHCFPGILVHRFQKKWWNNYAKWESDVSKHRQCLSIKCCNVQISVSTWKPVTESR